MREKIDIEFHERQNKLEKGCQYVNDLIDYGNAKSWDANESLRTWDMRRTAEVGVQVR